MLGLLDGEMKQLKAKGMGVAVKRAEPIDKREEDLMWLNEIHPHNC